MAFGFPPKYIAELPLEDLTPQQFLMLIIESATQLGWNVNSVTEHEFTGFTGFSMSSWCEEISVTITGETAALKSGCVGNQLFDWGKNKANINELELVYLEQKNLNTSESLDKKYGEFRIASASENDLKNDGQVKKKISLKNIFSIFLPSKGYFITPIVVNINILVFLLMVACGVSAMQPDGESLITWGANFRPVTINGNWWRLASNTFLHIGVLHLLFNMYALVYIGLLLEPYIGRARLLSAYILTGIAASTASIWIHDQTISAGASGAIFGLYGVFLALLSTNFIEKAARKAIITSIVIFVAYNLINGLKPGIDNAAHIGGLISGIFIGYIYYISLKYPGILLVKAACITGVSFVLLIICSIFCARIVINVREIDDKYFTGMRTFTSMENMALEIYKIPKTSSRDVILTEIKDRGIYYWNQNILLVDSLEKMNIPHEYRKRDTLLIHYCNLRLKSYNLIYRSVENNLKKDEDSLIFYNKKIELTVDSLKQY